MVCLSVVLLCYRITYSQFCNKKGVLFVPDPCIKQAEVPNIVEHEGKALFRKYLDCDEQKILEQKEKAL